eukprot:TRINITY_DN11235_c0_g1_i1.p1 TRINITY_DN11235_c0_g1~~TRINITY_DN11235_c0_g1_i1.p1  ORF type:complete len:525 (-),score=61.88 TRINITY_DN11235_c0_g1_i1:296-1723(-)
MSRRALSCRAQPAAAQPPVFPVSQSYSSGALGSAGPTVAGGLKLIVFDFDQTLSIVHVFKSLAGWGGDDGYRLDVPAPHATSELGQMRRVQELTAAKAFGGNLTFAEAVFGGPERVNRMREFLTSLKEMGVTIVVCTKGLVGVAQMCLSDLGLLGFFEAVYGRIGTSYGELQYDLSLDQGATTAKEEKLIGGRANSGWGSKDRLISRLRSQLDLGKHEAILVDDDPDEIKGARNVARTLWVRDARGLNAEQMRSLLEAAAPNGRQSEDRRRSDAACAPPAGAYNAMKRGSDQAPPRPRSRQTSADRRQDPSGRAAARQGKLAGGLKLGHCDEGDRSRMPRPASMGVLAGRGGGMAYGNGRVPPGCPRLPGLLPPAGAAGGQVAGGHAPAQYGQVRGDRPGSRSQSEQPNSKGAAAANNAMSAQAGCRAPLGSNVPNGHLASHKDILGGDHAAGRGTRAIGGTGLRAIARAVISIA